jgi:hypothetical protein
LRKTVILNENGPHREMGTTIFAYENGEYKETGTKRHVRKNLKEEQRSTTLV